MGTLRSLEVLDLFLRTSSEGGWCRRRGSPALSLGGFAIAFAARLRASALLKSRSSSLFARRPKPVRPPLEHQAPIKKGQGNLLALVCRLVPEEGIEPSWPCGHGILSRIKKGGIL